MIVLGVTIYTDITPSLVPTHLTELEICLVQTFNDFQKLCTHLEINAKTEFIYQCCL